MPSQPSLQEILQSWRLPEGGPLLECIGYHVEHAADITARDIEIGWRALDRKLAAQQAEFAAVLGADWVHRARQEFAAQIAEMQAGIWGNGRIVAVKGR